jgi:hypothetical protein
MDAFARRKIEDLHAKLEDRENRIHSMTHWDASILSNLTEEIEMMRQRSSI